MNSLLVVDDIKIRKDAFRDVEKLIKKLERLEAHLDIFQNDDQRLFYDWVNLTFRKHRLEIEDLHSELRSLMRFHNWMIGLAKLESLSLPEALLKLRKEELNYKNGSEIERIKIDEIRRQREKFIMEEMEREFGESDDAEYGFDVEDTTDDENDDENIDSPNPSRTDKDERLFQELNRLSDKKLSKICKSFDEARLLLSQAFDLIRSNSDVKLILRIWDSCSAGMQDRLSKDFRKSTGASLNATMEEMRTFNDPAEADENFDEDDSKQESEDFGEHFIGASQKNRKKAPSAESFELIKLTYRKLVRALHPDLQTDEKVSKDQQTHWQKKLWFQVQSAYQAQDLATLERLMTLVLVRERRLNDLRLSEIKKSSDLLLSHIAFMESDIKKLKSLPAWGFSRKKDSSALERKIGKEVETERADIQERIDELTCYHEHLTLIAELERDRPRRARRKPPKRSKRKN
jgi:hypothetical protein